MIAKPVLVFLFDGNLFDLFRFGLFFHMLGKGRVERATERFARLFGEGDTGIPETERRKVGLLVRNAASDP
jgi:hypothetical protein